MADSSVIFTIYQRSHKTVSNFGQTQFLYHMPQKLNYREEWTDYYIYCFYPKIILTVFDRSQEAFC